MAARTVDVFIKGRNLANQAFKDTEQWLKKLLHPMTLLKGAIAAMGVASLGALFKKATEKALEHERGLGRNVEQLNKLKDAWDFVLVRLGQALLGMDKGGKATNMFVDALVGFGKWIEDNRGAFEQLIFLVTKLAGVLGMAARGIAAVVALARGKSLQEAAAIAEGSNSAAAQKSFQQFQRERAQIKRNQDFAKNGDTRVVEGAGEIDKILAATEKMRKEREARETAAREAATRKALEVHTPGMNFGAPSLNLQPIPESVIKGLDVGKTKIDELALAMQELGDSVKDVATGSIVLFADTWADATQEMISGSAKLGDAIIRAGRRAVGGVLLAKGRETLLDAAKSFVMGFTNPVEFVKAAKLFAVGTAQMAAGQMFAGGGSGGGGGAGGLGGGGFQQQQQETGGKGDVTLVIEGGLLDMSDPRQEQAFKDALESLTGRRVVVVGG